MFALILDSLGSTELAFILIVALIFFGPRKLPQLARSMGKSLAEFRKASEDFKRTWEREVALESTRTESGENSILASENGVGETQAYQPSIVDATAPEFAVARQNRSPAIENTAPTAPEAANAQPESLPKHDWL